MKPRINACDDVNYHDTRYVVSNIDQTVTACPITSIIRS